MKNSYKKYRYQGGFTLIELMVTVLILSILVSVGVPAMNSWLNSNRLTAHTSELKQAIQYARSEAVAKNQDVSVCASSNGVACAADEADYSVGWIVVLNGDGTVLRVWDGVSDGFNATGARISFASSGESAGAVSFVVDDPTESTGERHVRRLQVNNVGWVTVYKGSST